MRFAELARGITSPRTMPALTDAIGLPAIFIAALSESNWNKDLAIAAGVVLLIGRIVKLMMDLNGLGKSLRGYNMHQDAELEDHERRLKRIEYHLKFRKPPETGETEVRR